MNRSDEQAMATPQPAQWYFSGRHPINSYLSLEFNGIADGILTVSVTAPEAFVADRSSRTVHSGLSTLILDTVMGGAVMGHLEELQPIATAGLSVQHLRRAKAGERLLCNARFIGIYEDIAHISAELLTDADGEILSIATGTFMIGTRSKPLGVRV